MKTPVLLDPAPGFPFLNFTPHPEYQHLLVQARALASIVSSQQSQLEVYRRLLAEERAKKAPIRQAELDSERAANEVLTNEVDAAKDRDLHVRLSVMTEEAQREARELQDWRELAEAFLTQPLPDNLRKPLWPNPWHQDCAAVALFLSLHVGQRPKPTGPLDPEKHCPHGISWARHCEQCASPRVPPA